MDYSEKGHYDNSFYQVIMWKRMNLIKTGLILQAIIFSIYAIMNILFTIFVVTLNYFGFYLVYSIISMVLDYLVPVMAITTIILFATSFFRFSNFFTSEIQKKIQVAAILLITYIAFSQLALPIIGFFIRYRLQMLEIFAIVYYVITNIIRIGLISTAFLLMNQANQKAYNNGLTRKTTLFSSYFALATGVLFGIFYIFYGIFRLPSYSFTIVFSLFYISIVVCFIEIIIFLNSLQTESLSVPESIIQEGQIIYKRDQINKQPDFDLQKEISPEVIIDSDETIIYKRE